MLLVLILKLLKHFFPELPFFENNPKQIYTPPKKTGILEHYKTVKDRDNIPPPAVIRQVAVIIGEDRVFKKHWIFEMIKKQDVIPLFAPADYPGLERFIKEELKVKDKILLAVFDTDYIGSDYGRYHYIFQSNLRAQTTLLMSPAVNPVNKELREWINNNLNDPYKDYISFHLKEAREKCIKNGLDFTEKFSTENLYDFTKAVRDGDKWNLPPEKARKKISFSIPLPGADKKLKGEFVYYLNRNHSGDKAYLGKLYLDTIPLICIENYFRDHDFACVDRKLKELVLPEFFVQNTDKLEISTNPLTPFEVLLKLSRNSSSHAGYEAVINYEDIILTINLMKKTVFLYRHSVYYVP